jgi:iron complex transport system substrate-binding protein
MLSFRDARRQSRSRIPRGGLAALVACAVLGLASAATAAEGPGEPRIVSVGGDVTEIVFALDAGDRLVAVDSTSQYPPAAEDLPDIGYLRRLSAEPILSLQPTQVLAAEDAGPPQALAQLRDAGVEVTTIPDDPTPQGVVEKVRRVARALGLAQRGRALADRLERRFAALSDRLAQVSDKPRVMLLLSVGRGTPMTAGTDTAADGIIRLSGGANAVQGLSGYKPLSPEAMVAAAPEVVLVTHRTLEQLGGERALLSRPALSATPAGRAGRVVAMDGLLLLGFGPRTPTAIARLAEALHPDLEIRPARQLVRDDRDDGDDRDD